MQCLGAPKTGMAMKGLCMASPWEKASSQRPQSLVLLSEHLQPKVLHLLDHRQRDCRGNCLTSHLT